MADVTYKGQSGNHAYSTTVAIPKYASLAVGQLMLAYVGTFPVVNTTAPSGWTYFQESTYNGRYKVRMFWKIADADDVAASTFTFTAVNNESNLFQGVIYVFENHDPSSPVQAGAGDDNYGSTMSCFSTTPSVANCMMLMLGCIYPPSILGFGDWYITNDNPSWQVYRTYAATDFTFALARALRPEITPTGTCYGSWNNEGYWAFMTCYIKPIRDKEVTPTTVALATTKYAPIIAEGITVTNTSLVTTGNAPSMLYGTRCIPTTKGSILAGYAPSIREDANITPSICELATVGYEPTISMTGNVLVRPSPVESVLSSYAPSPTVTENKWVTPTTLSSILSGYIPLIQATGMIYKWDFTLDDLSLTEVRYNQPFYLKLGTSSGLTTTDVSFIFDVIGTNYKKLYVYYGDTNCYVEVVSWDAVGKFAELHVKAPEYLDDTDTPFYIVFSTVLDDNDNIGLTGSVAAQSVWDSNYVFVSHMNDNEDGTGILDSTQYENHGTKRAGAAPTEVDGLVGKAQYFDGIDNIRVPYNAVLNPTDQVTVEVVLELKTISTGWAFILTKDGSNVGYYLRLSSTNKLGWVCDYNQWGTALSPATNGGVLSVDTNYYIAGVKDPDYIRLYLDGIADGTPVAKTGTFTMDTSDLIFSTSSVVELVYDEVRISNIARTADDIKISNSSMTDQIVQWGSLGEAVFPATLSLITTGYSPSISMTYNLIVRPNPATLSLMIFEPIISEGFRVFPTTLEMVTNTFIPIIDVTESIWITPTTLSLLTTGYSPSIDINYFITPITLNLLLNTFIPTILATDNKLVRPTTANLYLTGYASSIWLSGELIRILLGIEPYFQLSIMAKSYFTISMNFGGNNMHRFQYNETIMIYSEIKDIDGNLVNPTGSVKITITDKDGTVLVNAVDMTNDSLGNYSYSFTPTVNNPGWYNVKIDAVDGVGPTAYRTIEYDGFKLE